MQDKMILRLQAIYGRYGELSQRLASPELLENAQEYAAAAKARAEIEETCLKYEEYLNCQKSLEEAEKGREGESDPEMRALFDEEAFALKEMRL